MPEERYKEETKETKEAKETNKSCRKEGRYRRERSVKEKMKKSIAAVMGIAVSAALLLGGCASNTTDETKTGSSATPAMLHLLQIWIVCRLLIHQKSRLQAHRIQMPRTRKHRIRKHPPDRQNSHLAPTSETERASHSRRRMVYSHFLLHRRELPGQPRLKKTQRYIPGMMTIRSGFCRMVRSLPSR